MVLDAGRHSEDVGVEDDVLRRQPNLFGKDFIGARTDLDLARLGIRLALLVEGHDDDGRAVTLDDLGLRLSERGRERTER